jgi:hypothetical protein
MFAALAAALGLATSVLAVPPRLGGVNTAGYDFSVSTDGYDTLPYSAFLSTSSLLS